MLSHLYDLSLIADVFAVDIYRAAKIGKGILFDHATGVVVGKTAVIGNNVSILHHLTLGGTGKMGGDRGWSASWVRSNHTGECEDW
ncbi:hypothetical protein L6164_001122 [Bauhinia variegata]|uniref:Uncharacterized protein n=1 Tax=Bauhinia variegata TaxID=167791 RepID=A0ACB9QF29_BAUVA|nr:hypothetical protein L6164_001122 [Bauhinia variegata]